MDKPDQLRELFRMQQALNERIGVRTEGMSEADKTKWVLNYHTRKDEHDSKHI
jgi:hypothetical protein